MSLNLVANARMSPRTAGTSCLEIGALEMSGCFSKFPGLDDQHLWHFSGEQSSLECTIYDAFQFVWCSQERTAPGRSVEVWKEEDFIAM